MASWVEGRVVDVRRWTDNLLSLRVRAPEVTFVAGQFARLALPAPPGSKEPRLGRPYSFVHPPGAPAPELYFVVVPEGPLSPRLAALVPGDALWLLPRANGFFTIDEVPAAPSLWCLATGTGLAPFLSMLLWLQNNPTTQPIMLAYGVNTNDDLVELDTLNALKAAMPNLEFFTVVVDPASGHPKCGYVTDHLSAKELHDGNVDVYVCGPPPMVEGVRKWMSGVGVTPNSFHFEKFSSSTAGAHE